MGRFKKFIESEAPKSNDRKRDKTGNVFKRKKRNTSKNLSGGQAAVQCLKKEQVKHVNKKKKLKNTQIIIK